MSENESLNDITNELLLKYDDKFNSLYDKKLFLNSSIMNKEELINKMNDEIYNKDINIVKLKYAAFFIIIYCILFILYGMNKINIKALLGIYLILLLIYLYIINFAIYYIYDVPGIDKSYNKMKVDLLDYVDNKYLNAYTCPADCSNNNETEEAGETIYGYLQPTLKTDPQLNVWRFGDIPTDVWTSNTKPAKMFYKNYKNIPNYNATIEEELANQPKPFFGTNYPRSTYYKCEWKGGEKNNISMPSIEPNKYSSIPCSYRPNFIENGKYICKENPNTSTLDFNTICEDVSVEYRYSNKGNNILLRS